MSSKPCAITYAGKMDESASQFWLLAINFPLMVGHLVSTDDEAWHCFTLLLELTRIIFFDSISEFKIEMLEQLIYEFLAGFNMFSNLIHSYNP